VASCPRNGSASNSQSYTRPLHHSRPPSERYELSAAHTYAFQLTMTSVVQYLDMITTWGTWEDFQKLLQVLDNIAKKRSVSLTNIATRWILQQEGVGAVIVGTRLGVSSRGDENVVVFRFRLDEEEMNAINQVALGPNMEKADALYAKLGDCGNEYRSMH
jgi:predicted oxidoreductase